ncbi:MAG: Fur family transcriptional regulator [Candidatus Omnitrophota bacterium]|nr:Fur family transcriptional regulator [Candidatus Omnitrophota bacterium]
MRKEIEILESFIREKGLRYTPQREEILKAFLSQEKHLSSDELYKILRKKSTKIGYTTVYRTMKLLAEAGLCDEVDLGDGIARYEHKYGHKHHDHLICIKCGKASEAMKPAIEKMQDRLAEEHGFTPIKHKLEIFGICRNCKK